MGGRVGAVEAAQAVQHRERRVHQQVAGVDGDGVTQLVQPRRRLQRRQAAEHQVDQQGCVDFCCDALDFAGVVRRLHEDDVGPRARVPVGALDRRVQPERAARVGAGHHQQVVVGSDVQRGGQRLFEHRGVDDLLVGQVTAAFGKHLVLQLDGGHPGRVVGANRAHHVHGAAVTGVGVGDQRDIPQCGRDHRHPIRHLGRGDQADVGQPEPRCRHAGAGQVRRNVAGPAGQVRR